MGLCYEHLPCLKISDQNLRQMMQIYSDALAALPPEILAREDLKYHQAGRPRSPPVEVFR